MSDQTTRTRSHPPTTSPTDAVPVRVYRYYDLLMVGFATVAICSNFISSSKVARLGPFSFGAGVVFFPLGYIFGDVLTEVYGYVRSRRVIWAGFGALAFATLMSWTVLSLPPDPAWPHQQAWDTVFGGSWRIVLASLIAFLIGEWSNSVTLAKMKVWTGGRYLWARTIGSTIIGEAVNSLIFYPLAFLYVWQVDLVLRVMLANYVLKVAVEVLFTPITYWIVAFLKRSEHEDYFDYHTEFSLLPVKR